MARSQRTALVGMMNAILACSYADSSMRARATILRSQLTGQDLFADLFADRFLRT